MALRLKIKGMVRTFFILFFALTVFSGVHFGSSEGVVELEMPQEESETVGISADEAQYLRSYGWVVGHQSSLDALGLTDEEFGLFAQGLHLAVTGEPAPADISMISSPMQEFLRERAAEHEQQRNIAIARLKEENKIKEEAFFAELAENLGIEQSPSGLFYEIIYPGLEKRPAIRDKVAVHYEGRLLSGYVFDSSKQRGEVSSFIVDNVIEGFKEGLQMIGEGGKIILYIPAKLGYKDSDIPGIPPGSTLIFNVELLNISPEKV